MNRRLPIDIEEILRRARQEDPNVQPVVHLNPLGFDPEPEAHTEPHTEPAVFLRRHNRPRRSWPAQLQFQKALVKAQREKIKRAGIVRLSLQMPGPQSFPLIMQTDPSEIISSDCNQDQTYDSILVRTEKSCAAMGIDSVSDYTSKYGGYCEMNPVLLLFWLHLAVGCETLCRHLNPFDRQSQK